MSQSAVATAPDAVSADKDAAQAAEPQGTRDKKNQLQPKVIAISGVRDGEEGEKFIPVSQFDLLRRLGDPERWPDHDAQQAQLVFDYLTRWRNLGYSDKLDRLTEYYLPFDPDTDITCDSGLSGQQLAGHQEKLFEELKTLIEGANYDQITQEELDHILAESSPSGVEVHVNLGDFEEQMLYARGASVKEHWVRDWRWLFLRKRCYRVPIFERLFLALKFKSVELRAAEISEERGVADGKALKIVKKERAHLPDGVSTDHIYLKVFKCIPQVDLEMLFPNTRVRLKYFDKLKLWITGGGGGLVGVVTAVPKIVASVASVTVNPIGLVMALGGLVGLFFRQVMNFFNTRNKYMMQLAQNLYFQSLANNRGVLTLLIDRAEEEDIKEDTLLYSLLAKEPMHRGEIDDAKLAIEMFLAQEFGVNVNYDIHDAMNRLKRDGLLSESEDGILQVLPPEQACAHLKRHWMEALDRDLADESAAA